MSDQGPSSNTVHAQEISSTEPVWTYRGYQLRASDFTTSMNHLFRGEITRANAWRQRLDATTNWAVITTGAVISFAFNNQTSQSHAVIILNTLLVTLFLVIETRRYRYYELWSYRVRLMETDFFAAMLVPPFRPAADWAESLAANLLHPRFPVSFWEAFGRRMRRNYMWIYALLGTVWLLKVWTHPTAAASWAEFLDRAAIGGIPGAVVLTAGLLFNGTIMLIGFLTYSMRQASGEVLPLYGEGFNFGSMLHLDSSVDKVRAWFRHTRQRQQIFTHIITDLPNEVSERIIHEMHRGVTRLNGTGMYTGKEHSVLIIALMVTEVPQLKAIVSEIDPHGFVVVTPAQEILGGGFMPLKK